MGVMGLLRKINPANWGKEEKRPQLVEVLTEYGEIIDEEIRCKKGFMENSDTMESWGLDTPNQVRDEHKRRIQVISEIEAAPIPLWHQHEASYTVALVDAIAVESTDAELAQLNKEAQDDWRNSLIAIGLTAMAIAVVAVVIKLVSVT